MFLRKSGEDRDPLVVAMSGVRRGERVLQIGVNDAPTACRAALKAGLSGHAAIVVQDDASRGRVATAAAQAGAMIDLQVAPLDALPFDDGSFDVAVVNGADGLLASLGDGRRDLLREAYRVIRPGGRIITVEPGTPVGLLARLRARPAEPAGYAGGVTGALADAGFGPVRDLGDLEGLKFAEGFRR